MQESEILQLKNACIILKAMADTLLHPEAKLEILEIIKTIIKAIKYIESPGTKPDQY